MTLQENGKRDIVDVGEAMYEERIRPLVEKENAGKYVVVNVETGAWALGDDTLELSDRLLAESPNAPLYALRIGHRATARLGRTGDRGCR